MSSNSDESELPVFSGAFYECSVCGRCSVWTSQHGYIERPAMDKYNAYDAEFIICSDECRSDAREPFIIWLSNLPGWTKKTATENYDKYILEK